MKRARGKFLDTLQRVRSKSQRQRWQGDKGQIYEEDTQHGELEKYNRRGQHEGSAIRKLAKSSKAPSRGEPWRSNSS
jgi:hypothetical protein